MSEGDSVGESIHGKPSVVTAFFTRIGQVKYLELKINDKVFSIGIFDLLLLSE